MSSVREQIGYHSFKETWIEKLRPLVVPALPPIRLSRYDTIQTHSRRYGVPSFRPPVKMQKPSHFNTAIVAVYETSSSS